MSALCVSGQEMIQHGSLSNTARLKLMVTNRVTVRITVKGTAKGMMRITVNGENYS